VGKVVELLRKIWECSVVVFSYDGLHFDLVVIKVALTDIYNSDRSHALQQRSLCALRYSSISHESASILFLTVCGQ